MKTEPLRLNAFTRTARHQTIPLVREALLESGGDILDVHFFSNISLCINFELPARRIEQLTASLAAINLNLSAETLELLSSYGALDREIDEDESTRVAGTLQITFIHNEPDLRLEVPAIPG